MSFRTNRFVLLLRGVGRTLGMNKVIAHYMLGGGYEIRYDRQFAAALRQGDCVWDVGANVGYYTRLFSERVGMQGSVVAFEPSPLNYDRLTLACASLGNVHLFHCGLGKEDCQLHLQQGADDLGATSRIVDSRLGGMVVDIRSGTSMINEKGNAKCQMPNAIKIDVEGFEYEVLLGLGEYIKNPALHLIGIEVHFGILKGRGVPQVPQQIEMLLHCQGFRVSWPDSSHLIAIRNC